MIWKEEKKGQEIKRSKVEEWNKEDKMDNLQNSYNKLQKVFMIRTFKRGVL